MVHEIVTLCGSTRFKKEFLDVAEKLSSEGRVVLMPSTFSHAEDKRLSEEEARELDEGHIRKIDNSNGICVIDVGGYIGGSTKREIDYAIKKGKSVRYYSKEMEARG